jgi:LmbE family N-acetylglucosaminyl deacetylase
MSSENGLAYGRSLLALAGALALAAVPSAVRAKTILVVAAHPDDEIIMAAGRISTARSNGDTIKIVIMTNGDIDGVASGLTREGESVQSALTLGLTEQDVIFLGYPDGASRQIYDSTSGTRIFTSAAGQTATYGSRGLGGMEYHRYLYGVHGSYNRNTMLADFQALLTNFRPDEVYTHSHFDAHGDHEAVALFLTDALVSLKRSGVDLRTKLYESIVWMYASAQGVAIGTFGNWPQLSSSGWTPLVPILPWSTGCVSGDCLDLTPLEWNRVQHFVQPPSMQVTDQASNLKALALPFQGNWFISWVRRDEFFWLTDFGTNLAATAQVTASSEDSAGGHAATRAVDGIIGGLPDSNDAANQEWVTLGQLAGAWIQLDWPSPVRVAQVNLYDRIDTTENVLSGALTFSDGTSVSVGALPRGGRVLPVTFPPRTVSWVRFTVNQAQGSATGLTEMQVLGASAASTANIPPHIVQGPVAAADTIPASRGTTLSVVAHDLDGDPLQYQWSAEGGFIQGNGASAAFTPPPVTTDAYLAVTVNVLDGRGGVASNSTFIHVTPAPTDSVSVSPSTVFGGDGTQGTVVLASAAPAGGTVVPLSSGNTAAATVPAAVTVAAGATTATFPVGTSAVVAATPVTIVAAFPNGARPAALTVMPRAVSSVTLSPTSVLGGTSAQGAVTLPGAAGGQGATVQLFSSNPALAAPPASVTVPAGATGASFAVATSAVAVATPVTISATYGTTASAVLTVGPLALSALALNPVSVVPGASSLGTVSLNGPAGGSGAVVSLSSSDSTVATVPPSVTVPSGASAATFSIATNAAAPNTAVTISASFGGVTWSVPLTVSLFGSGPANPNLLLSPEQIGAAPWLFGGDLTPTLSYAAAPDGTQHATRAVSSGGGHTLRQVVTVVPGTAYTLSFFAQNHGGTAASYSVYDYVHGADIVPATSYVSRINGSRYSRIGVTFTVPAGCNSIGVYLLRDSGGPVDVLLWGAKLEVGSTMTAYQLQNPDSVTVSPSTVASGGTAQGTIALASFAPPGGTAVALSSSNPSAASVPATVTVPVNATSATFTVNTGAVSATTTVTISAAFASGTRTATLTVTPVTVSGLTLSPASVVGGGDSQGTVTLNTTAPPPGVVVQLSTTDGTRTSIPVSLTVPAGSSSASFVIGTSAVTAASNVTLSASYGSSSASAALALTPQPVASSLTLNPASLLGGSSSVATVTLNGAAGGSGAVVVLTSSFPTTVPVPATVTVPAGATSTTFAVSPQPVGVQIAAILSASYGGATQTATLTVSPPELSTFSLSPTSVLGGLGSTGTVALSGPAPGGYTVALSSSDPAATLPALLTVPAGAAGATFTVTTVPVAAPVSATISASLRATTRTATLVVAPLSASALALNPASVLGGGSSTGTVGLNGPAPAGGAAVALASSNPAAMVPASVNVAAGATSATFTVSTVAVPSTVNATISASYGGATQTAGLAVTALLGVSALGLSPTSVAGGGSAAGTVTLNGPAPAGGALVALSSGDPAATVPASVTVAAGATSAAFTVSTTAVAATTSAAITASYGASAQTATLTVSPPGVASLALSPTSLVGGASSTATVTLSSPAPAGGLAVTLSSSSTSATVPASAAVAAGATGATFTVTTAAVAVTTTAVISASYGGTASTASLAVLSSSGPSNPNLLSNPEQIGGTGWDSFGAISTTLNFAVAPDGTQHATRATSGGGGQALRQVATVAPGTTYTVSFFARNNGGTSASYSVYDYDHGADIVPATPYVSQLNGSSYTRVIATFTVPAGCTSIGVYPLRDSGGPVDLLLWGAKLEVGPTATPY